SASGTSVVLPAPGGASRTRQGAAASAARISGSSGSIGRGAGVGIEPCILRWRFPSAKNEPWAALPSLFPLPQAGEGQGEGKSRLAYHPHPALSRKRERVRLIARDTNKPEESWGRTGWPPLATALLPSSSPSWSWS